MIERLSFAETQSYSAIESAIHLCRYSLAKDLCAGKKVLDISCGEGYGSSLMGSHWGAAEVHGVDISEEAIAGARERFGADSVTFHCHPAEDLDDLFEADSFDLIVCLETMEHVPDAEDLLASLRRALRPDGVLVLSCPNDWWYYPKKDEGNPFHVRKFTFEEFGAVSERVFGPAAQYLYGLPIGGFANVAVDAAIMRAGGGEDTPLSMFRATTDVNVALLPAGEDIQSSGSSYFVGVWGGTIDQANLATYPASMDRSDLGESQRVISHLQAEIEPLHARLHELDDAQASLLADLENARHALRNAQLLRSAWQAECEYTRQVSVTLKQERDEARLALAQMQVTSNGKLFEACRKLSQRPVLGAPVRWAGRILLSRSGKS